MKIAEIKEMTTSDLVERVEAEVANYSQMVLNHSISPLDNPAQIKQLRRTIARMKTEEFCCPEIQTHILHDKMIMKKEKTYSRAPLPFVGQKRMFVSEFKKILKHFDDKTIFVDLFGGSGLLSHITKRERPDAVVIYNDHDKIGRAHV